MPGRLAVSDGEFEFALDGHPHDDVKRAAVGDGFFETVFISGASAAEAP
jgi:hypothetical protein